MAAVRLESALRRFFSQQNPQPSEYSKHAVLLSHKGQSAFAQARRQSEIELAS